MAAVGFGPQDAAGCEAQRRRTALTLSQGLRGGLAVLEREAAGIQVPAQAREGIEGQQAAEKQLSTAMMKLIAVAEQYPELKANTNFLDLQQQLAQIEGDLEKSRRYYTGTVREQNTLIESFPSNLVANGFGFKQAAFFELDSPAEKAVPNVKFA